MANQQNRGQQLFRYRNFHINKSQPLGHGAYGAVYKAKCDQLPCAAKVLHPTILDPNDPGAGRMMHRFEQECAFLESIRHPNIVQYLGMTRDPESRLPVLLMELLDEGLTKMLEHSQQSLAYCVQVDICHDIALAVAYLHSIDIIHRDLSSNNVLIMAKSRAKVTDFGMSKLAGEAQSMTPLTMCPGTVAYMSPEALREPPVYTKKLDCFSEGVIMIQVCTRLWPEPGPRTKLVPFPASPTGMTDVPVLEPERRKNHIDMIDPGHGLLPIAVDCLHYQENERPSSEELCQRLAGLKETSKYRESVEQVERVQNDIAQLERQRREMQVREEATIQQLHVQELHHENQQQQSVIQSMDVHIKQLERQNQRLIQQLEVHEQVTAEIQQTNNTLQRQVEQLQQLQELHHENQQQQSKIQSMDVHIKQLERQNQRLIQQLEVHEQVTAEIQQTNNTLQRQVEQLQLQLSQQIRQNTTPPQPQQDPPVEVNAEKALPPLDGGSAPYKMARGAAVVDGNVAYFMNYAGQTCSYDSSTRKWNEFPNYPYWYCSLAVIKGLLTGIGGNDVHVSKDKKKLMSIVGDMWVEYFPPMPTKRHYTAAVTTKQHLVVAGGKTKSCVLDTVEVMDIETLVWSIAAILPHPYSQASATICGDQLYMLGGFDKAGAETKSVLTCSLTKLLQSCGETSPGSVWHRIADVPVYSSICAAINGKLVAVGGVHTKDKITLSVHKYNPTTDSWDIDSISNMPTARRLCLVAVLPTNEVMVVGGFTSGSTTNIVEIIATTIS